MRKIIRLTESDLNRIVKRVISEQEEDDDSHTDKLLEISEKITELLKGLDIVDEDELYEMGFEDLVDEVRKLTRKRFFKKSEPGKRRMYQLEDLADELESLLNEE
jgi:hypothetical protein